MKYVVVTGASSGIGLATVQYLLDRGYYVFGSVRKDEDAKKLARLFAKNFQPLIFDVTDEPAIATAAAQVKQVIGDSNLSGLVNNAGMVISAPILHVSKAAMREQFDVNTFGAVTMAQVFFPLLKGTRGQAPGRIVNVTSISAEIAVPFLGPYSASKRALMSLCHTLRREYSPYGIKVVEVMPGRVNTGIIKKLPPNAQAYQSTDFAEAMTQYLREAQAAQGSGLSPESVAATVYQALSVATPKLRYVRPDQYLGRWKIPMNLPLRLVDRLLAKRLRLLPAFLKNEQD